MADIASGQSAWWTWRAPSDGVLTVSVAAPAFSPLLSIYTGSTLTSLSLVASNNYLACYDETNCGCHWRMRDHTTFHVTAGEQYQISADSAMVADARWVWQAIPGSPFVMPVSVQFTNIIAGGAFQLTLKLTPAPPNDDFDNPIRLKGSRLQVAASNLGAGKQAGEPAHLGNPGGSSVWYVWTAPASGRVTLSTQEIAQYSPPGWSTSISGSFFNGIGFLYPILSCGAETDQNPPAQFYPVFAAYTGSSVNSLSPANCLPVALSDDPSAVEFNAVKGQTYHIAFDGNLGTTGDTTLYLALTKPAVNDDYAQRIKLHGVSVRATGYNAGATYRATEPLLPGSTGKTVWWSWRAPVSGPVTINLTGSDYGFPLAVFTGSSSSKLELLAQSVEQSAALGFNGVSFEAAEGQTYQIAVGDAAGQTGAIRFTLQAPVIEVSLLGVLSHSRGSALLRFRASPGQVILLLRSSDGNHWSSVGTATTHRNSVEFLVHPAPAPNGYSYKAVIVDKVAAIHAPR